MKRFADAWRGLVFMLRGQWSAKVHAALSLLTVALALALEVPATDWRWLIAAMVWVWTAEALNTGLETLGDAITRDRHEEVGRAKDVAAGGVLVAALGAAAIGAMVFVPPLRALLS